jgi:hypothetical protein
MSVRAGFAAVALVIGLGRMHAPWIIPIVGVGGFVIGRTIGPAIARGWGRAAAALFGSESVGTYAERHSNIDALEARGDYQGAVNAWEAVAVRQPRNTWPLIRAGELYVRRLNDPRMGLERFRNARDLAGIKPELHRYTSQKIIDLYLGPLSDERRGMAELRRLMEMHPGTREADGARETLAAIKAKHSP